ncbi:tyrosine-type recombinase/integrase [Streptomyces sp. Q6]|uniref:Tyrosine-type recombinase/integrase n=1 Tax=Streptomyces citrinus TaxID=3118173 RepID=A0ACD5AIN7_9ACTN
MYATAAHGDTKRWSVRYRDSNKTARRKSFASKGLADQFARKTGHDLDRGALVDPEAARKTLREVAEEWLKLEAGANRHRLTTAEGARRQLERHVLAYLGGRQIGQIKRLDIERWLSDRKDDLAASTLEIVYGRFKAVLTHAVVHDYIPKSPAMRVPGPDVTRPEIKPLPLPVVQALALSAPPRYRALVWLAAGSGLRLGELLGLERSAVDLEAGVVHVRSQLVRLDKGAPFIGEPKTQASYRSVPLAPAVVEALRAHLAAFPPVPVELVDRTDTRKPHSRPARLVFANGHGNALNTGNWSRVWSNTVKRANTRLTAAGHAPVPVGTSMHSLRHFYASMLIQHRESVKVVQRRLGHSKPSTTLDVYVHLWDDVPDTTADAVQGVLGALRLAA